MMVFSIFITFISCLVQGIMSNYFGYTYMEISFFSTIYGLIALLVIRPYFENEKKYIVLLVLFGLMIDVVYTNTFILNTCLFVVTYCFSKFFHHFFPFNLFTMNISNLLGIFLYHIISFIFLTALGYDNYTFDVLFRILTHSIMMTVLYTSLIYGIVKFIYERFQLRKVK